MTSTFDKIISIGTNNVYFSRTLSLAGVSTNYAGRWDGNAGTVETIDNGVSSFSVTILAVPNTDTCYVAGTFTQAGGSLTVNRIAYHDGTSWNDLNGATVFDNTIQSLAYDHTHNLLYAASYETTNTTNRISFWNGTTWTGIAEPTLSSYPKLTIDSNGNLYVGYSQTIKRYLYNSSTWETLDTSIGGTITEIKYNDVDNRVYIVLYISSGSSIKYYDIAGSNFGALVNLGGYPRAIAFSSSNDIYVARQSPSTYQGSIVKYNGTGWDDLFNHQNVSGVLDIEMDANDNIFCFANAGSLTIGVPPYTNGNWEQVINTSSLTYGGPRTVIGEQQQGMNFQVGDSVCLATNPTQHGTVIRLNPLGVQEAIVVIWENGPIHSQGKKTAHFGQYITQVEHV